MTADSSLTGVRVTPVACSTFSVADPQGTWGAQTTTWVPGFARSANEAICFGFPGGVTMVRVLVAKLTGSPVTRPASTALVMLFVSAEANTSAGAPCVSWVTRSEEPAKLNVTFVPGLSFSIWAPNSVKVAFSDAAANTVMSPVMLVGAGDALPVVVEAVSFCDDEQLATRAAAPSAATATEKMDLTTFLRMFR